MDESARGIAIWPLIDYKLSVFVIETALAISSKRDSSTYLTVSISDYIFSPADLNFGDY